MDSIGEQLIRAREARGLTMAEVAEATRIKPTHIAAMERSDFGAFPSPIYARGFIKLYAECVGLDPGPLLDAYRALAPSAERPAWQDGKILAPPHRTPRPPAGTAVSRFLEGVASKWRRVDSARFQKVGFIALVLAASFLLLAGVRGGVRSLRGRRERRRPALEAPARPRREEEGFLLLERPPDPYIDSDSFGVTEEFMP